jgi:hypothetical protein
MKTHMKKSAWLAIFAILVSTAALAGHQVAPLDGTSWKVDVKPDDMAQEKGAEKFEGRLTFADGKLTLTGSKAAFDPAPYTVQETGKKELTFKSEQTGAGEGTSVWTGTIHGNNIEGKRVWTKANGEVWTYTFSAQRLD